VNQPSSRKHFFAKLLGAAAAASALPKAFATPSEPAVSSPSAPAANSRKFEIRGDARAVARRDMI
jgi:hypothetical protein